MEPDEKDDATFVAAEGGGGRVFFFYSPFRDVQYLLNGHWRVVVGRRMGAICRQPMSLKTTIGQDEKSGGNKTRFHEP